MPTVSVVIPTYNNASVVKEAIQSVLEQTLSDYEIIVVDDGSTDNTREVVSSFSDKRIRYVYQENHGRSSARNHAISIAQGRYIAFLDSDDLFLPTKLEKQVTYMEKNPGVLLSHTSYLRVNAQGEYIEKVKSGTFSGRVYPEIVRGCPIATPTVMIQRRALGGNLRFEENILIGEDVILWTQLARKSIILGIDEPLAKVRIRGNNAALDPRQQIIGLMNMIEYTIRWSPDFSFIVRRRLLSDIYLKIGFNYLRIGNVVQFLKFSGLAEYMQPLEPPFLMMGMLSSKLHLEPLGRFRRIYGKLNSK
jgi:glycosyltransferase involved in cell wall biosynthesis